MDEWKFDGKVDPYKDKIPQVTDFDLFLPWACRQFSTNIVVTRAIQEPYVSVCGAHSTKVSKRKISKPIKPKLVNSSSHQYDAGPDLANEHVNLPSLSHVFKRNAMKSFENDLANAIKLKALYDINGKLVQIKFLQNNVIPRQIMQVLGLTIPYQQFLTSISINSGLSIDTLYELSKVLPHSYVTELYLDNAYLNEPHYHILLKHDKLKYLSLARCSINDAILKTITDKLVLGYPSSTVLSALNLSSNRITDVGAKYIAYMLRTNRQLSYLNLAGNMITDEGGMSILDTLQKFPLESQEFSESRVRFMTYLKQKKEFIEDTIKELQMVKDVKISKKKFSKKSKQDLESRQKISLAEHFTEAELRAMKEKAEHLAETKMESFNDPFSPSNTEADESTIRCLGNNTLCYLNLAYNNLSYVSVRKLLEVLLTQNSLNRTPKGLVRVVIEGNLMPETCEEYEEINRLLAFSPLIRPQTSHTKVKKSSKVI